MLIDTHAHLDLERFDRDRESVISRAISAGVTAIINVGFDLQSSRRSVELARRPGFYAAAGIHPHDAKNLAKWEAEIERLLDSPGVVAVGEIGLDYYRNLSTPEEQRRCFAHFISIARKKRLPVIVHDRDAHEDIIDILKAEKAAEVGGVLHCFSGDWDMAKRALDLGFYISFAGPVTYTNATRSQNVAARVPEDRLLVETDCPYLAPHPYRGMRNEPGMVRLVAEKVASLRGLGVEQIIEATGCNAARLFALDKGWRLRTANYSR